MWQHFLEVTDLVAKLAQTAITGFVAWLAWKTFLKEEAQEAVEVESVPEPEGEIPDLKLFETSKQTTWLTTTSNGLECRIDERREGKVGGHMWTMAPQQAQEVLDASDIHVNAGYKIRTGLLTIGNHTNWLYSKKLFPDAAGLQKQVIELLKAVAGRTT